MELKDLYGQVVKVIVPVKHTEFSMNLKVTRVNTRTVTFMEVVRAERKNVFRKVGVKKIDTITETEIRLKEGATFEKSESSWDSIGTFSNGHAGYSYRNRMRTQYRNSTTNSYVGFPMV